MSVVVRDENNKIRIICKGADTVILSRLSIFKKYLFNLIFSEILEKKIVHYLEEFGKKGLRTLVLAEREVSEEEYSSFMKKYYKAITSTKNKHHHLDLCYETLEKDLTLIGCTAIEDCLQDDLSKTKKIILEPTLESFRQIGIKVWMLTGDHPFTAVSIGHSCGLIENNYTVKIISSSKLEEINNKLFEIIDIEEKDVCLVITGNALAAMSMYKMYNLKSYFNMAIKKAKCVICSRVTPKQKADLVLMVKDQNPSLSTMAIGDGANDVNMITSADVGIGLMGNEGQQAARASDYVISQFSFLKRLMMVHGREAYRKNSFAVCYILFKNCLFVTPMI
jgi:phospholipid-transporting ATPase